MEADSKSPYKRKLNKKVTKEKVVSVVKRLIILSVSLFILFMILNFLFPLKDKIQYSTAILDADGEVLHSYLTTDDKWRLFTEPEEISPLLRKTIIAKEDKYFYTHPGVNPLAVGRAALYNIIRSKRTSGASTITMQVARALEHRNRSISAKMIETFRAFQLEWKYSKDEILQMYLNLVPYGGNIEGVKAASLLYFQKNPDHLSLAQIVSLSIIPNRPSSLVIGKRNDLILQERNKWLQKFEKQNVFTAAEIRDALAEPLDGKRTSMPRLLPHLSQKLRHTSAINVKTNIVTNTQLKIEKLTEDYVRRLRLNNIHNAAVIVVDNTSGKVISYIGSADFKDTIDAGQVNGAAAIRQPGSTLKPLLYGLCIDAGLLTPKTIINDVPVHYAGYNPENYDRKFNGAVTLEYALDHSLNIPAVRSLQQLGTEKFIGTLIACDFKQIQKDQQKLGLSTVLGGCGSSLEQLTGLFSAFAREGIYIPPEYLQQERHGKAEILSREAAYMINEILSKVNRPDFPLTWSATEHMPKIAWKTGTSFGRRDAWSIGYNKKYTVGVWVGNFSGEGVPELSGANTATPLLFKIFNTIDYDSDSEWFNAPEELDSRMVCSETGLPPSSLCTDIILDHFIPLISSTKTCDHIREIKISSDERISYCEMCAPATGFKRKTFRYLQPELLNFYIQQNKPVDDVPPHNPACEKLFRGNGPKMISPKNGTEYYLDLKEPEPVQLTAYAGADVSELFWYINDKFYKKTRSGEKQFFIPEAGTVKISCTDDKGRNTNVKIMVRYIDL